MNKYTKVLLLSILIATIGSAFYSQPTEAIAYHSVVPTDAVKVWGTQWNNMSLWLSGGQPLSITPIDGIYTTSGDFPSLVFNTTEFTEGTDYSIYQFGSSGTYKDMWFTMMFSFDNITANNYFSAFLLSGKEGDTQYSINTLADAWTIMHNGESTNMTEITPGTSGIIDVFMHFDATDGYITTYLNGNVIDNTTAIDTGDGVGGFGFQVDSNDHSDDCYVALSHLGAFIPLADVPTPTPHTGGSTGGASNNNNPWATATVNPYSQWTVTTPNTSAPMQNTASPIDSLWIIPVAIVLVLGAVFGWYYRWYYRTHH